MRLADLITGAVLAISGVVFLFWIIPLETVPGDEGEIAPALMPMAAMTVMTVLGLVIFGSALWRRPGSRSASASMAVDWGSVRFFFSVAIGLFGALAAVWLLGFVLSGILIVLGFAFFLARDFWRQWRLAASVVLVALAVPVAIYYLAWHGLRLSLP